MQFPLELAAKNASPKIHVLELLGVGIWISGFLIENVADMQLTAFSVAQAKLRKKDPSRADMKAVMKSGLWRYSRHPNYFGEFLLWVGYAVYALPVCASPLDMARLLFLPVVAYYYLVHFTGIFMAEQVSVQRRGEAYVQYQQETSMFFPWFPTKINKAA
jgi:steroid 5-alpha reductase family enzyme